MNDPRTGCDIGQGFGLNYNPSYGQAKLNGHTGVDEACGYGSEIQALTPGLVYSVFSPSAPASDGYTAVYTLCRTPLETFEFSYGHVSEILVPLNFDAKKGDVIAKEGNRGTVYSGNVRITPAMQAAGDHRGAHRHYQKRPVIATKDGHGTFLQNASGVYRDAQGNYFVYAMPNNGFAGCVDWTGSLFNRDLGIGDENYWVLLLQRALVLEGYGNFDPTGYFGVKTRESLRAYQKAHSILSTGFCGPLTRKVLNETYKQLV